MIKSGGYVYILASDKMGTLYIGSTSDLLQRVWKHKQKIFRGFTSKYNVMKLVYYEWHENLECMVKRERQLKEWQRNWKLRLIIEFNPEWKDLYPDILHSNGYSSEGYEN